MLFEFGFKRIEGVCAVVVLQENELVFHLIVLELQGLQFSLKVVHFFSLAVKIVLHE